MASISITDDEKIAVRASVFHHLAGIVLAPTVRALLDRKVFDQFHSSSEPLELDQIEQQTHGNRGYLRVALRLLASCGWIEERREMNGRAIRYSLTKRGNIAVNLA
jgi:hypothetical protein